MSYSLPTDSRINTHHALFKPTPEALRELLSVLCSTGLWKLGSCYEDMLDTRPFSSQYNSTYFHTAGAMCVAFGITSKATAAALETAGIMHLKVHASCGSQCQGIR